jgi:hypothetical protein
LLCIPTKNAPEWLITLVRQKKFFFLLPGKIKGNHIDLTLLNPNDNQNALSPTMFKAEGFKMKNYVFNKKD